MALNQDEVRHIAKLCRVGITDEEVEGIAGQLSQILDLFEVLTELDTTDVSPIGHSMIAQNVMRADESVPSLARKEVFRNAPKTKGDHVQVNVVLEE